MSDIFRHRVIRLPFETTRTKEARKHALFRVTSFGPAHHESRTPEHRQPEVGHGHGIGEGNEPHPHIRMGKYADEHVEKMHRGAGGGYRR